MAWRIEIDKDVQRSMKKLDKQIARRIVAKLHEISQLVQIVRLRFFRLGGALRHILQPLDDGRA